MFPSAELRREPGAVLTVATAYRWHGADTARAKKARAAAMRYLSGDGNVVIGKLLL
jgi:hypothetical protein